MLMGTSKSAGHHQPPQRTISIKAAITYLAGHGFGRPSVCRWLKHSMLFHATLRARSAQRKPPAPEHRLPQPPCVRVLGMGDPGPDPCLDLRLHGWQFMAADVIRCEEIVGNQ